MHAFARFGLVAGTAFAATAALAGPALAATTTPSSTDHSSAGAVFVQNDSTSGNQVFSYDRNADGTLTQAGTYNTGGLGGMLTGSKADHLASQGSLTYDAGHSLLYAVNAGSNTVSVFSVQGDELTLSQTVSSGGDFPVSVAVHNNVVYVLNALNGGSIQGFVVVNGQLVKVNAWNRSLNLNPAATPQFLNTPGQVGFSTDGSKLIVTTKANTNAVDVFSLGSLGVPSATPVVTSLPGTAPWAFVMRGNQLVLAEETTDAVATFTLNQDDTLTQTGYAATGQLATCWVVSIGGNVYVSNTGSGNLSGYQDGSDGSLTSLGLTSTDAGPVDFTASPDGQNIYAQTGTNGMLDEFHVNADGSLTEIGSLTVPNAIGGEGIAAS